MSGTPAEEMLQTRWVKQVAGDDQTRFFRPADNDGHELTPDPDHLMEAYNWGQLTSGTWKKALWLLLVPFGLVNAAHFMLVPAVSGVGRALHIVAEAALRVLGLVLTVAMTLAFAEAFIDLTAWQWTGIPTAAPDGPRLADPRWAVAGALAACGLLVPLLLWFGGRQFHSTADERAPMAANSLLAADTELISSEFEVGDPDIPTLRMVHLGASWTVLAVLGFSVLRNNGSPEDRDGDSVLGLGWSFSWWLLGALLVLIVLIGNPHRLVGRVRPLIIRGLGVMALVGSVCALVGAGVAVRASSDIPTQQRGVLPGITDATFNTVATGSVAIVVLTLSAAMLSLCSRRPHVPVAVRRYLGGMTSPALASVGLFLGVGFGASLVYSVRWLLSLTSTSAADLHLPLLYPRIAHSWGLTAGLILIMAGTLVVVWRLQHARFETAVRLAHNVHPYSDAATSHPTDLSQADVSRVASAWWRARIKLHIQMIFAILAVFGLALTGLALMASIYDRVEAVGVPAPADCADDRGPAAVRWLGWAVSCSHDGGPFFIAVGSVVLLVLAAALIYLGRRAVSSSHWRRSANVVWDVVAFWPRAAHPLVPPPYTARALDQLRRRIYWLLGLCPDPGRHPAGQPCNCDKNPLPADRVVLAAHSQGSLLAVAAVAGLRLAESPGTPGLRRSAVQLHQLALLTFGSQLQFAYARAFPAYVNSEFLGNLIHRFNPVEGAPGWISLLRETDPIGGQVFSWNRTFDHPLTSWRLPDPGEPQPLVDELISPAGVRRCGYEWRLLDPIPSDGESTPRQRLLGHSGYFVDPAWQDAITLLTPQVVRSRVG